MRRFFQVLAVLAAGVLYQKPRIVLALGVLTAVMLWGLVRALLGRASAARVTSKPAPEVAASASQGPPSVRAVLPASLSTADCRKDWAKKRCS